jgi:hypothetical protein
MLATMATPEWAFKHHRFQYLDSFRLLRLMPSQYTSDKICIDLIEDRFSNAPPYEALSYTRGSPGQKRPVYCDGKILHVTTNCEAAMRQLRLKEESRMLWVDAICIDQDCIEERNHQVGIIGGIYRSAKCVLIWLGEATIESHIALEILSWFKAVMNLAGEKLDEFVLEKIRGTVRCQIL